MNNDIQMTEREAIEALKLQGGLTIKGKAIRVQQFFQGLVVAEKALEKQIAKKPRYVDTRFRNHGRSIADGCSLDKCYQCPTCGTHLFHVWDSEKYCKECGQLLDWGNEDAE